MALCFKQKVGYSHVWFRPATEELCLTSPFPPRKKCPQSVCTENSRSRGDLDTSWTFCVQTAFSVWDGIYLGLCTCLLACRFSGWYLSCCSQCSPGLSYLLQHLQAHGFSHNLKFAAGVWELLITTDAHKERLQNGYVLLSLQSQHLSFDWLSMWLRCIILEASLWLDLHINLKKNLVSIFFPGIHVSFKNY